MAERTARAEPGDTKFPNCFTNDSWVGPQKHGKNTAETDLKKPILLLQAAQSFTYVIFCRCPPKILQDLFKIWLSEAQVSDKSRRGKAPAQ